MKSVKTGCLWVMGNSPCLVLSHQHWLSPEGRGSADGNVTNEHSVWSRLWNWLSRQLLSTLRREQQNSFLHNKVVPLGWTDLSVYWVWMKKKKQKKKKTPAQTLMAVSFKVSQPVLLPHQSPYENLWFNLKGRSCWWTAAPCGQLQSLNKVSQF